MPSCNRIQDDANYISPQELSQVLVEVGDLPAGWTETQRETFNVRELENPSLDNSLWCPKVANSKSELSNLAGDTGADVELEFRESNGVFVAMRLQAWSNADAKRYFSLATSMIEKCDGESWTDNDVEYTEKIVDGVQVGDSSISWQVDISSKNATVNFSSSNKLSMVLFGDVIALLQHGKNTTSGSVNSLVSAEWLTVANIVMKRLENQLP